MDKEPSKIEVGSSNDGEKKNAHHKLSTRIMYVITKQMAYRPIASCCCMFLVILAVVAISIGTGFASFSRNSDYDWIIASTEESKNHDALSDAKNQVDKISTGGVRQESFDQNMFVLFDNQKNEDLYQPKNLQRICEVEALIALDPKYLDFCRLDDYGNCTLPESSISVYFYGFTSVESWNCSMLSEAQVNEKKEVIYSAMSTPEGQQEYGLWLSRNAPNKGFTERCNSIWSFGAPLEGFNSTSDRPLKQFDKYSKFVAALNGQIGGVEESFFDHFEMETNEDNFLAYYPSPYMDSAEVNRIDVLWFSSMHSSNETSRVLFTDLLFAMFSIAFVFIWIRFHTGSFFLACSSMYMIFFSLPFSLALYKGIYGIPYFSQLHSLVLFIVLGIGADDVFVLVDSWKMTEHVYPGDITNGVNRKLVHQRLLHCYKHTMDTVFNTSFTTAVAFIATGFSPLMPIATFGWYAATCVLMNYVFVITLMPPATVLASIYFSNYIPCTKPTGAAKCDDEYQQQPEHGSVQDEEERSSTGSAEHKGGQVGELELVSPKEPVDVALDGGLLGVEEAIAKNASKEQDELRDDEISTTPEVANTREREFKPVPVVEAYIDVMSYSIYSGKDKTRPIPIVSLCISLGLLAFGIIGVYYGNLLTTPSKPEAWYPSQHMFTKVTDLMIDGFLSSDENAYTKIYFTFGISGIDRSDFNIYKPGENRGSVKFTDKWDLALPACQKAMLKMCSDLEQYACTAKACGSIKKLVRINTTECFIRDFRAWVSENYDEDTYLMQPDDFYANLSAYREVAFQKYSEYSSWQDLIGVIEGNLKFGTVSSTLTLEAEEPLQSKLDVYEAIKTFESKVRDYDECNECNCDSLRVSDDFTFQWMRSEEGLVTGFYQGLMIAFPISFAVLLFATGNIIISIYAIISVFFIVFGVLGFTKYALNWELGIAESIAGIIIIGFAVDYTVHLGHMYTEGEHVGLHDRRAKFEYAARKIALTIVGGAITTVGAGIFMFACQLTFFTKMAALIVATILLSYVYSLGFFMAVLYVIGPERNQGNLHSIYLWLHDLMLPTSDVKKVADSDTGE